MAEKEEKKSNIGSPVPYAEHFGNIRLMGELLRDPSKRPWETILPPKPTHHRYVVWLGCHVIRTAHLAETLDDILNCLAEDFVTLGGPSNCCGITHDKRGDVEIGRNMLRQTSSKFDAFTPDEMLCWCPSCDHQLRTAPQDMLSQVTKDRLSVAKFLADKRDALKLRAISDLRLALHWHGGHPEQQVDADSVATLLSAIPGVSIHMLPASEGLGRHCSEGNVSSYGMENFREHIRESISLARKAGATHLTSIYHSCHREMLLIQQGLPEAERMPVLNYLTVVARSLGLPEREDKFARYTDMMDIGRTMEELEPNISKLKINPNQAERALRANFIPKK